MFRIVPAKSLVNSNRNRGNSLTRNHKKSTRQVNDPDIETGMIEEDRDRETLKCTQRESFNTFLKTGYSVESVLMRRTRKSWPASSNLIRYRTSKVRKRSGSNKKTKRASYKSIETIEVRLISRTKLFHTGWNKKDLRVAEETVYYLTIYYTVEQYYSQSKRTVKVRRFKTKILKSYFEEK